MAKLIHGVGEPIKFCPSCRQAAVEMKDILQRWGKNRHRPDGLEVYCRECRRKKDRARYQAWKEWAGVEALREWMTEGLEEPRVKLNFSSSPGEQE